MHEIWKDIWWYEWYYQISNYWKVKSLGRRIIKGKVFYYLKPKLLKLSINWHWYRRVILCKDGKKNYTVHRLVASAFIKNTHNKKCVNHIDWNKLNNYISNLEWSTYKENNNHSLHVLWNKNTNYLYSNDNKCKWSESPLAKGVNQLSLQGEFIRYWGSIIEASNSLSIHKSNIASCCRWQKWTAWWFIWRFSKKV